MMKKSSQFVSKSRKIRDNIEEVIGQIFLWSFVIAAFILLQNFFSGFLHWIFYLPLCIVFSIPLGFSVVIGTVALMNFVKRLISK
ncbi:MAG: hypothetical protein LBP54_07595 [Campylobacteraceae bacterium]|jgi:hypothetical protein|nr:hypothetical protein [Campylobacteraceae bacterium]